MTRFQTIHSLYFSCNLKKDKQLKNTFLPLLPPPSPSLLPPSPPFPFSLPLFSPLPPPPPLPFFPSSLNHLCHSKEVLVVIPKICFFFHLMVERFHCQSLVLYRLVWAGDSPSATRLTYIIPTWQQATSYPLQVHQLQLSVFFSLSESLTHPPKLTYICTCT